MNQCIPGFTLLEFLIVIGLLGILAACSAYPSKLSIEYEKTHSQELQKKLEVFCIEGALVRGICHSSECTTHECSLYADE